MHWNHDVQKMKHFQLSFMEQPKWINFHVFQGATQKN